MVKDYGKGALWEALWTSIVLTFDGEYLSESLRYVQWTSVARRERIAAEKRLTLSSK